MTPTDPSGPSTGRPMVTAGWPDSSSIAVPPLTGALPACTLANQSPLGISLSGSSGARSEQTCEPSARKRWR